MRQVYGDILATFWLPALAGSVMAIGTWLVWFYSGAPVSAFGGGSDAVMMCRPAPLAPYLNLEILHYCYLHATLASTITGGSDIMLFIRESRRNQRAEKEAEERRQREREEAEERYERERQEAEERRQQERQQAQERYAQEQERHERERQEAEARRQQERQETEARRQQERQEDQERYAQEQERRQQERREAQEHTERLFAIVQTTIDQPHEERRLAEEERRLAEDRYRQDLQRAEARAAEERRLAEERYRQDREDRQRAEERAEARAAADRQDFVNILAQFSAALARNGGGGDDPHRPTSP